MSNERLIDNVVFAAKDDGTFEANILREDGVLSDVNPFYYASLRVDKGVLRILFGDGEELTAESWALAAQIIDEHWLVRCDEAAKEAKLREDFESFGTPFTSRSEEPAKPNGYASNPDLISHSGVMSG